VGLGGRIIVLVHKLEYRGSRLLTPGIADDDVEATELLHYPHNAPLAERLIAQIAGNGYAVATRFLDELNHFPCIGLFGWQIVDGYIRAFARVSDRGC